MRSSSVCGKEKKTESQLTPEVGGEGIMVFLISGFVGAPTTCFYLFILDFDLLCRFSINPLKHGDSMTRRGFPLGLSLQLRSFTISVALLVLLTILRVRPGAEGA